MLDLFEAARAGDIAALTYWIEEKKVDINQRDSNGFTPFLRAAQSADLKTLKWLVEHGADVQLKYNIFLSHHSALNFVLFEHAGKPEWQAEKASWLLSQGLSMPESFKLLLANDLEALQKRYAQSPSVLEEREAEMGYSLLHLAAGLGQLPSVLWLLKMGLPLSNANNQLSRTPLHVAAINGHVKVVEWLVREGKAEVGVKTDGNWTGAWIPLHVAAMNGHVGVVEWLVREGKAEMGVKDNLLGLTPLHYAARNGHVGVVEWLVREGKAEVGVQDYLGSKPLHYAARNGHVGVVEWLVREGRAEVGAKNNVGGTPLHYAARNGHVGVVEWLVWEGKAEVGVQDKSGDTPLQEAINKKHLAVQYWFRAHALFTQPANVAKQSAASASHLKDLLQFLSEIEQYTGKDKPVLVASLMPLYLEALATNHTFQNNFLNADVLKWRDRSFETLEQPTQQKLLQLSIKLGLVEITKILSGRQQFMAITLHDMKLGPQQADALAVWQSLNPGSEILTLSQSGIDDHAFNKYLVPVLQKCTKLRVLDLSGNLLTDRGLENLLKMLKQGLHPQLKTISLQNNRIEIADTQRLQELAKLLLSDAPFTIELAGNALFSEKNNKDFLEVWRVLLRQSNLTVQQLLKAEFVKLNKHPQEPDKYLLELQLAGFDQTVSISLPPLICSKINGLKQFFKVETDHEVFDVLRQCLSVYMPEQLLNAKYDSGKPESLKPICKQIVAYHPASPLKSHFVWHPVFRSTRLERLSSLLMPEETITLQDWKVYLLADKKTEHAMLVYEGLRNYGQRFFKVAHLTVQDHSLFKTGTVAVSFLEFDRTKGLTGLIAYLLEKNDIAVFTATRQQVNTLHGLIKEDERKGVNAKYIWLISGSSSVQTEQSKQAEITNCLKWALDKISYCLDLKFNISLYQSTRVVNALKQNRSSILNDSANTKAELEIEYNNNSSKCLMM